MEPTTVTAQTSDQTSFMHRVYAWMAGGLLVTGLVAYGVAASPSILSLVFANTLVFYGLLIAELGIVFYLSFKAHSLSTDVASVIFFAYAALNGVTLSLIFLVYTASSVTTAFLTTAGTFGLMSLYGSRTKKDLTSMGSLALMGLLGIILASIVNLFLGNDSLQLTISVLGIIIFTALTAYDAQKIKQMRVQPVIGALHLYLDFINIFLYILQLGGKRRN